MSVSDNRLGINNKQSAGNYATQYAEESRHNMQR